MLYMNTHKTFAAILIDQSDNMTLHFIPFHSLELCVISVGCGPGTPKCYGVSVLLAGQHNNSSFYHSEGENPLLAIYKPSNFISKSHFPFSTIKRVPD